MNEKTDIRATEIRDIPVTDLIPFKAQPFMVKHDDEMAELIKSISYSGIIVPAVARPKEDGKYELISGHRRLEACKALGMETMPVIIREMTDDEAVIMMVDSNLQREHILPSEKAFAYAMKYTAIRNSTARREKGAQSGHQLKSIDAHAENSPDSRNQIQRYIRLTNLISKILLLVDDGKIGLTPAVELSYLQDYEQEMLYSIMESDEVTPSLSQAQRLRHMSELDTLTEGAAMRILSETKGNQIEYVKIPVKSLRSYFRPNATIKQMTETLVKAMEFYKKYMDRQRNRDDR